MNSQLQIKIAQVFIEKKKSMYTVCGSAHFKSVLFKGQLYIWYVWQNSKYFIYVCFSYENASSLRAGLVHGT